MTEATENTVSPTPAPKEKAKPDAELRAIKRIGDILKGLSVPAQRRALSFYVDRLGDGV